MASSPAVAVPRFPLYESVLAPRERKDAKSTVFAHLAGTPRLARVTAASHLEVRPSPATVSSGVAPIDALAGGLPRGCLTEITGLASSGRTSVLLATLATATQRGEICALIDAADAFDPTSGAAAGIDFDRLLWVRCTGTSPQKDNAKSPVKSNPDLTNSAQSFRSPQRSSSNPSPSSRATRREPRPSRQLRESRDGYVTAPTHRAAADAQGVRNFFHSTPESGAHAMTAQADFFLSAGPHPHLENAFTEDPLAVWKRRLMEDPVEQALRAADLLLQSGGFGMIAIDLGGIPAKTARRIPLATWFRFRRVIEPTPTVMLLIDECPCAQACASLSLQMAGQELSLVDSRWSTDHRSLAVQSSQLITHTHLLEGLSLRAELLRARTERKPVQSVTIFASKTAWTG
jgi:recombination protein RecA